MKKTGGVNKAAAVKAAAVIATLTLSATAASDKPVRDHEIRVATMATSLVDGVSRHQCFDQSSLSCLISETNRQKILRQLDASKDIYFAYSPAASAGKRTKPQCCKIVRRDAHSIEIVRVLPRTQITTGGIVLLA